jgi:hypothetical protein
VTWRSRYNRSALSRAIVAGDSIKSNKQTARAAQSAQSNVCF